MVLVMNDSDRTSDCLVSLIFVMVATLLKHVQ